MEKKSLMKKLTGSREALLAVILLLLFAVVTVISPSFLTPKSILDMLKNNAVTMVMALGMLCVMLVGGIDISIMSTLALSGMAVGMLLKYGHISNTFLAFVIALAIGTACGFLVGLVISRADVPPIIATMGFMYAELWDISFPITVNGLVQPLWVISRILQLQNFWESAQ